MTNEDQNGGDDERMPSEFRRDVTSQNQFQLPACLVSEIGFEGLAVSGSQGATTAWFYHERHDKVVLASKDIDRPSLEMIGASRLSGISNADLASGDVDGGRITIITDLPEHLHERLTRGEVVLKPVYASKHPNLDYTFVSVYPAREYDCGALPNVDHEPIPPVDKETSLSEDTNSIGRTDIHANSS